MSSSGGCVATIGANNLLSKFVKPAFYGPSISASIHVVSGIGIMKCSCMERKARTLLDKKVFQGPYTTFGS